MWKIRKFVESKQGVSFIASLIMLLIAILVAAALVSTVAFESEQAAANTSVAAVPGGPAIIDLWPLLFIIAPVLYIVKEVFF
ncbi:MAG: hypothetical protein H7836_13185 [Magnetococcus sp. YQC-3]